jgi:agmatinase
VFDPSVMPSTGTPEPGGPDYRELMFFLREVFRKRNVIGFDVVELCPSESNKAPDFMAAKVIYQMLSYKFRRSEQLTEVYQIAWPPPRSHSSHPA